MPKMMEQTCHNARCTQGEKGKPKVFEVRVADVKRGWGKFCCKKCKAQDQQSKRPFKERSHSPLYEMLEAKERRAVYVPPEEEDWYDSDEFLSQFDNDEWDAHKI